MKRLVLVAALSMTGLVWAAEPTASASFSNDEAKVAYSLGFVFGKNNAAAIENLNVEQFVAGFKDGYAGKAGLLTEEDLKKTLNEYKERRMAQAQADMQKQSAENKARSQAFLAENAKKQGVVTTATGLQYEVITQGTGVQPKSTDTVEVHYVGTLTDGTVFDSSVERGQTASFRLDQVIAGWTEGVQLMKQGSKYRFTIPSELAYGESGAGAIPANAVLVFEVELIKVTQEQSATTTTTKTDKKAKKK
jgi:FKBP-type peptidyl-prolyl cis-trans isomerase FklB